MHDSLVLEPAHGPARACVIWLHGLGADARDFAPIVPELGLPSELGVRFVFPNAPYRPITVNGGYVMRGWYDIFGLDIPLREDEAGIRDSARRITALLDQQRAAGIPAARIVLAGFSQGCAIALHVGLRYRERLAGILGLSGYLPLAHTLEAERATANRDVPILLAHGVLDELIPCRYGELSAERLRALGYAVELRRYPMGHEVCWEEIREIGEIGEWLGEVLAG
ncbi:MAG TPA: carboxylesterase [Candidatus Competibacteraceae bacterium]|nr:carboxylesterase [Candidatus Competibacteraceae bacterium]